MAKTVAKVQMESKPVIAVNETEIKAQLGQLVRASVEETLNGLLEAEADRLCKAPRYQRRAEPRDIINASCRPRLARSNYKCPSCGACPSRPRSSNVTGGGRVPWKKPC